VLRLKDGALSVGEIRPAKEGEPLADRELVRLTPLDEGAPVCEVEVLHAPAPRTPSEAPAEATGKPAPGPARVSSESYRKNWSTVFGAKRKRDFSVN